MHCSPRHTPNTGTPRSPKWRIASFERPASSGRPGPGEISTASGRDRVHLVERDRVVAVHDRLRARAHPGTARGCRRTSRSCRSRARGSRRQRNGRDPSGAPASLRLAPRPSRSSHRGNAAHSEASAIPPRDQNGAGDPAVLWAGASGRFLLERRREAVDGGADDNDSSEGARRDEPAVFSASRGSSQTLGPCPKIDPHDSASEVERRRHGTRPRVGADREPDEYGSAVSRIPGGNRKCRSRFRHGADRLQLGSPTSESLAQATDLHLVTRSLREVSRDVARDVRGRLAERHAAGRRWMQRSGDQRRASRRPDREVG